MRRTSTPGTAGGAAADPRRALPALHALLDRDDVRAAVAAHGRERVAAALRAALQTARERAERTAARDDRAGAAPHAEADRGEAAAGPRQEREPPAAFAPAEIAPAEAIVREALAGIRQADERRLRPVINATGVLLHTNLGRAPLSAAAIAAVAEAAGATSLELDLADGRRGGRGAVAEAALARLCGAEDALVVNNGAAALVLALRVLAADREVIVSRGELVEIGGSFRLPEIMAAAGVRLVEVGTTNRTHLADYRAALSPQTGALLRVHPSNFALTGFTARPATRELAGVAAEAGVPLVADLGSGLLQPHDAVPHEPTVPAAVAAGADLAVFSGDKLLGGPQAGALVGRREPVSRSRRDPLARALRVDKLRIAALEATVAAHERGQRDELPVFAMAAADVTELQMRAERVAGRCGGEVVGTEAVLGGGSAPDAGLASVGVAVDGPAEAIAARLRAGHPAVLTRIVDGRVVADLRAVPAADDEQVADALAAARVAEEGA